MNASTQNLRIWIETVSNGALIYGRDTYTYRETIKAQGGVWSKQNKAWFFHNVDLANVAVKAVGEKVAQDAAKNNEPEQEKKLLTEQQCRMLDVKELKTWLRAENGGATWISRATRRELIHACTTGNIPARFSGTVISIGGTESSETRTAQEFSEHTHDDLIQQIESLRIQLDAVASNSARPVEIRIPEMPSVEFGISHKMLPELVQLLACKIPVYLCGPAGSAKSSAGEAAAEALSLDFYVQSVCAATSKSDIMGYQLPGTGEIVRTAFRNAYENGGVFMLDEIDAGNANVTLILNSALANKGCTFPDKYVIKHPDFRFIATANTFGQGADRTYVGRNQLDGATLDRFAFLEWEYDQDFENALSGNLAWAKRVQAIRRAAMAIDARVVISPRASIMGAQIIAAGKPFEYAEKILIWNKVSADVKSKILARIGY